MSKRLRGRVRVLPRVAVVMLTLWPAGAGHSAYAQIRTDEEVIFFPSFGARFPGEAAWRLEIRGWIFELEMDSLVRAATLDVFRGFLDMDPDSTSTQLFEARARMFLVGMIFHAPKIHPDTFFSPRPPGAAAPDERERNGEISDVRVAQGGYPPWAPTDPHVRPLAHAVPQIMVSLHVRRYTEWIATAAGNG